MRAAVDDARALLATLLASGWHDIHVVSGRTEIFIARDGGRPNPLRQATVAAPPVSSEVAAPDEVVTAPHVATMVDVLTVGTIVAAGQPIATIRVLDTDETITAPQAGTITAIHAQAGELLEYKVPVVSLRSAAR